MKRLIAAALAALAAYVALVICLPLKASAVSTSAQAAALINGDTGELIYAQNADSRLPMASTTKIMTALLLCETGRLDREITVTKEMVTVEGSSMGLLPGDRVTYHDLLYGMLLASGNDAANTTAISVGGSVDGFVKMMNARAAELGLKNTNFVTPSGLDAEGHCTTAYELALLAMHAMKNEDFAKAASTWTARLCYGNPPYNRSLTNHNKLLKRFEGTVGVKTGFTKKSGRCLVSAARRDGKFVIAVTLNDPNDWSDHENLLEYGFGAVKQTSFLPEKATYTLPVMGGEEKNIKIDIPPYTLNTSGSGKITCSVKLPRFVYAPLAAGDVIGCVEYYYNGRLLEKVPLTAGADIKRVKIEKTFLSGIIENLKEILKYI